MKCPNCKEPNLMLSERRGIEIDYCPECRGVWLDRGELDKLLEKDKEDYKAESRERSYNDNRDRSYKDDRDYREKPYKRKKSLLEELFD